MSSFLEDLLSGEALLSDLDDYVERWHEAPEDDPIAELALHDFLGLTWQEYQTITERPQSLRFVVAAHKHGTDLSHSFDRELIAARGASEDAQDLYKYLVEKGRVG